MKKKETKETKNSFFIAAAFCFSIEIFLSLKLIGVFNTIGVPLASGRSMIYLSLLAYSILTVNLLVILLDKFSLFDLHIINL